MKTMLQKAKSAQSRVFQLEDFLTMLTRNMSEKELDRYHTWLGRQVFLRSRRVR